MNYIQLFLKIGALCLLSMGYLDCTKSPLKNIELAKFIAARNIKVIIGLGNPGQKHHNNRHNIGFKIIDKLARDQAAQWQNKVFMHISIASIKNNPISLIKPATGMNNSGDVAPFILKQNLKPQNTLVIHDELEKPFGSLAFKIGSSHRGHNGLRSLIAAFGSHDFARLRFGIGRPAHKEDVPEYVVEDFTESEKDIKELINKSVDMIAGLFDS